MIGRNDALYGCGQMVLCLVLVDVIPAEVRIEIDSTADAFRRAIACSTIQTIFNIVRGEKGVAIVLKVDLYAKAELRKIAYSTITFQLGINIVCFGLKTTFWNLRTESKK